MQAKIGAIRPGVLLIRMTDTKNQARHLQKTQAEAIPNGIR